MQCLAIFILVTMVAIPSQQSTDHDRNNRVKNGLSRWDDSQETFDSYEDVTSYPENQRLDWSKRNDQPNQYDEWSTSNAERYRQQQPKLRTKKPKLRVIYKKRYRTRNKENVHSQSNRDYEFNSSTGRQQKITNKKTYRFNNRSHKDVKHETVKKELNKQRQVNSNSYERRTKTYRTSEHKDRSHEESDDLSDEQESITVPEVPYGQNASKEIQSASAAFIKMLVKKLCGQYEKNKLDLEPLNVTTDRVDNDEKLRPRNGKSEEVTSRSLHNEAEVTPERFGNTLEITSEILDRTVKETADEEDKTAEEAAEKENLTAERVDKTSDVTVKEADVTLERADVTTKSAKVSAEKADIASDKSDVATKRADGLNEKVDEPAEQADEVVKIADVLAHRMDVTPEIEDNITAETSERLDETAELADRTVERLNAEKFDATAERADVTSGRADEAAERVDKTTDTTAEIADITAEGAVDPLLLLLRTITKAGGAAKRADKTTDVTTNRANTDVTSIRAYVTVEKTDEAAEGADATAEKGNETADRADAERADVIAEEEDKTAEKADVTAYTANLPPKRANTTAEVTAEKTEKTAEVNAKRLHPLFSLSEEMVENDDQMVKVTTEIYDTATDLTELDKLFQVSAENMAAEYMDYRRPSDVLDERENEQLVLTDLDHITEVSSKQADKTAMRTAQKTIVVGIPDKVIEATPKQSLELNNDEYWLKVKPKLHGDTNGVSEHNPVVNFYYFRLLLDLLAKHKQRAKELDKRKIDKLIALTKNNSGNIDPELLYKYLLNRKTIDWNKLLYIKLDVEDTPKTLKYYWLIKDNFERYRPDKDNVAKFVSSLQNRNVKVHSKLLVLLSEMLRNHEQETPDHPMVVNDNNQKMQELLLQKIKLLYSDKVPLQERKKIALIVKMLQNVKLKTPPRLHNTLLLDYLNSHKPKDIDWDEVFTSIREANNNKSSDDNRIKDSKTSELISNCDENYKKLRRTVEYILGLMNDKMGVENLKINS